MCVACVWSWMHKCRCRDMSTGHEHGWASRCDVAACTANQVTTLESYLKSACQLRLPQRTVCNAPHRARHPQSGCPVTPLDIANSQAAAQRSAQYTTSTGCPPAAGRRQQDAGVRMPAAQHWRRGAGVHRLGAQCATPALPQPALPLPALPQPALPQPALPQPAVPQPALPQPALSQPVLPQPALPCRRCHSRRYLQVLGLGEILHNILQACVIPGILPRLQLTRQELQCPRRICHTAAPSMCQGRSAVLRHQLRERNTKLAGVGPRCNHCSQDYPDGQVSWVIVRALLCKCPPGC